MACRCVDCGFVLSESSVHWPTCKPLARDVIKTPETSEAPGARNKQAFTLNGGSGTHLDAPAHFIPGGRTIELITPQELVNVPLAIVDVSDKVARDADYRCSRADVENDERAHGAIPAGSLVCIRTGWAATRYGNRSDYYNAVDPSDVDDYTGLPRMHFPGVALDAARYVVDGGARGLAIDTLNPEGGFSDGSPVHHEVLGRDRYIVENVRLGPELPARGWLATVAPLCVAGAPEAPARFFAWPAATHWSVGLEEVAEAAVAGIKAAQAKKRRREAALAAVDSDSDDVVDTAAIAERLEAKKRRREAALAAVDSDSDSG